MLNIIYSITFCFEIIFFWRKILLIIVALRNAIIAQLLETVLYFLVMFIQLNISRKGTFIA